MDDNAQPTTLTGGGPNTAFVQEAGGINPLPGTADGVAVNGGADNDYYFAGLFTMPIPSVVAESGEYEPVGEVAVNEEAAERAFAGSDNDLRYHFNLPETLKPTNLLSVTFDVLSLDGSGADERYGIEVYVNGVLIQPEILIRPPQFDIDYTTPQFSLESVNAQVGPGHDNIVSLRGINYNTDGGGNWMGIDYVQLNQEAQAIPAPVFPWAVGKDDDQHAAGDGGGPNATFVQEDGTVNPLPGSAVSTEAPRGADNDYYLAGSYTRVITGNGTYEPVGTVSVNEEAAERAFAGGDNELRYHFNLPNTLLPTNLVAVSFDALDLDTSAADPRYGVEVYVNGVKVQSEIVIRPAQLDKIYTTPQFTLGSVNAGFGAGADNIVALRGISYDAEGGGNWMGIDHVQFHPVTEAVPAPVLPWSLGMDDDEWPAGEGGGTNASFVQESGTVNPLPGSPSSTGTATSADNDYYFGGLYTTVIAGNGDYGPVGTVTADEGAAERGFSGNDNELRYHFNLPGVLKTNDLLSVTFDARNLDTAGADPRYGVEVFFNGVLVQTQVVVRTADLDKAITTAQFTVADVNGQVGPGFDNILTLRGTSFSGAGGGNSLGLDYVRLNVHPRATFPWGVGRDDNSQAAGDGGGLDTTFVQEAGGINPLPGSPVSTEVSGGADNDYYFAGDYSTPIASVVAEAGEYTPVGTVLVNEESAERAFAGADNDLRYHFNLPSTLAPTNELSVSFDPFSLQTDAEDPRYGIEVYVNGVLIQPEIVIRPEDLDKDFVTPTFTLQSVNAGVGPGHDNIVSLRGINYNAEGGGNWMGLDYIRLNQTPATIEFPWTVGMDDDGWPVGDGGGANATFVQEEGTNPLPGSPDSKEANQEADDDYYFAGVYTNIIAENGDYFPVGIVSVNEEAAERAFAGTDNDLRYHFNLPATLRPTNMVSVSFDIFNLDTSEGVVDPRYGIEVYFNGVLVQPEMVIRTNQLDVEFTTPEFTLQSVNAQVGPGHDNIVSLKGVSYNAEGGGNWMGIDHVRLNDASAPRPARFTSVTATGGQISMAWTGGGILEWSPVITGGTWTPVSPAPNGTHTEPIVAGQKRFFRVRSN